MTYLEMVRRVTREWSDHPVCVFLMGDEFAVATPNTPDCVELEMTKGIKLLGTYKKSHPDAKAAVAVARDL